MSYKVTVGGMLIEADTLAELTQLIGAMKEQEARDMKAKAKHEELEAKILDKKIDKIIDKAIHPAKRRKLEPWTEAHYLFLIDNIDDREKLKSLPYKSGGINAKVWAFKNNKWAYLPAEGKKVLELYNDMLGRVTPKEFLPKI